MAPMQVAQSQTASQGSCEVFVYLTLEASVLKVDMEEVISDQLSDRECNKLPVTTPNANDPMLMGARSGTAAYLAIRAAIQPSSTISFIKIGVRRNTVPSTIINSVAALQSPQKTLLNFTAADGMNQYEVVGGVDADNDGLEPGEVCAVFPQLVRVVTFNDYDDAISTLNGPGSFFAVGIAQDLLDHFLTGGAPSPNIQGATRTFYLQSSTEPDHPLGQDWNTSCQAPCGFYTFADGSAVSDAVEETFQIQEEIRQALAGHASEVQNYFATPGSPDSHQFPVWSWSGGIAGNDWLDPLHFHPGIFGAFGGVDVSGTVQVTVRKSDFKVTHIHYTGAFDDLYDFNITRPLNAEGATVQAGYPTFGVAGRIFKTHVDCDVDTTSFNYTFPASP